MRAKRKLTVEELENILDALYDIIELSSKIDIDKFSDPDNWFLGEPDNLPDPDHWLLGEQIVGSYEGELELARKRAGRRA
jgi:hypothetical protein